MISIEVDGVHLPAPLAGHPALEFCNTWAGWNSPPGAGGDYLTSYDVLLTFATHHGLLTGPQAEAARAAESTDGERETLLHHARRLRGVLYELLTQDASQQDRKVFAAWANEARSAQRWTLDAAGSYTWALDPRQPVRLPLLAVADSATQLLTDASAGTVHACPGRDCGWLFLDPRGRRKWCAMAVCGNRAKARAHAQRADHSS